MKRCFSAMNAQQAPCASRQARGSAARQTASTIAQSRNGGSSRQASQRIASVASALGQLENRFSRSHFTAPSP